MNKYNFCATIGLLTGAVAVFGQQNPVGSLFPVQVESAFPSDVEIAGIKYVSGEIVELPPGRHDISVDGPFLSTLGIVLDVSQGGRVQIMSSGVSERCSEFVESQFQVSRWNGSMFSVDGLPVLAIQGPEIEPRREQTSPCGAACCGWDNTRYVSVQFTSTPAGAMIIADGRYVDNTNKTLSIPYGVSRDGNAVEEVTLRVARTGYIGCTYFLTQIRANSQSAVDCQLRTPTGSGSE